MAEVSKREFAEACGIKSKHISTHVSRGKIILTGEGRKATINDSDPLNILFKATHSGSGANPIKKKATSLKKKEAKEKNTKQKKTVFEEEKEREAIELFKAQKRKTDLQNKKLEAETAQAELRMSKARGEMVPMSAMVKLIRDFGSGVRTSYTDALETQIILISAKSNLTNKDKSIIRKEMKHIINKAVDSAIELTSTSISVIAKEYSENRGIGESR